MKSFSRNFYFVSLLLFSLLASAAQAQPSFHDAAMPAGWTATPTLPDASLLAARSAPIALKTNEPVILPTEVTFKFQLGTGERVRVTATDGEPKSPALLETSFQLGAGNSATINALADGKQMATVPIADRPWYRRDENGPITYAWRYPKVSNAWDARDRQEIGAAYSKLVPFASKTFSLRLVLTRTARQVWIDDRLLAEVREHGPEAAFLSIDLSRGVRLLSTDFAAPVNSWKWTPLHLADYNGDLAQHTDAEQLLKLDLPDGEKLPVLLTPNGREIDLGQSLYRFRTSAGSGPFTGYINALNAWPSPFLVDPAELNFRVPYRDYQNAWLLVWLDYNALSVPRGVLRFYREDTGAPASTAFSVDSEAVAKGLATELPMQSPGGKPLYLVKVPLNTAGLAGMRDQSDQFLDFALSKPVYLTRSYPDPIYYGEHPGGLPSSVHIAAITLEAAPFKFDVQAGECGDIYEAPEQPSYTVAVTNTSNHTVNAKVFLATKSFDEQEKTLSQSNITLGPGKVVNALFSLNLRKYGWHELKVSVVGGGASRTCSLSLVYLPRNRRTYGNTTNETRFGAWVLWGHYTPFGTDKAANEPYLAMLRKLGIRRISMHTSFLDPAMMKKYNFLPNGPHTVGSRNWDVDDPVALQKAAEQEVDDIGEIAKIWPNVAYFYGGEWDISREIVYAADPRFTGDGPRMLNPDEKAKLTRQMKIFTVIGEAMRKKYPSVRLTLQWGGPQLSVPFLRAGFPTNYLDNFGMDLPEFETLPEASNAVGPINILWTLRKESQRLRYWRRPINWTEGPFFPTNPGALTEKEQADYQVRAWLMGLAYGVDEFSCGIVPFDAGNYYGSEHYGQGIFHRTPLENPKPAVAAIATATSMLCGLDPVGSVPTGNLATYCQAFARPRNGEMTYALWRVRGTCTAMLTLQKPGKPIVTDSMGNATPRVVAPNGTIMVSLSSSPIWLTGAGHITAINLGAPQYEEKPAPVARPLSTFAARAWGYDGGNDKAYADNHFAIRRITDWKFKAEFGANDQAYKDIATVTLPVEPGDRPLANRYGALVPAKPIVIPGKPKALGVWIKGNASWGRIAYQLRDAKGETWTSTGSKDEWNCDDTHGWSSINFEGWRYVRFPLPGSRPFDAAREQETTWWGSRGGDGIVDYPLTLQKIFVEARNEVPYLSQMKPVPERSYKLANLLVEYEKPSDETLDAVATERIRMPLPAWEGPMENPIAQLAKEGSGEAPVIGSFTEPPHFNDGRRMVIHFQGQPGFTYKLYLSLYADGRGAELLNGDVKDGTEITGLRPEAAQYLFMTSVDANKKESKPSPAFMLVTHDNFAEK